ncbi:hypothetical protein RCF27_09410 [Rhodococcus pyridinivorans]|uniref:hypothetical protein n=1 Tax=Rhodococcus pyridinivorans TaxID=103816 RepID=UPI00280A6878|nr:hypothetical protein [Rhodococcus pyridinivorans]WMM74475.1 hypothetical protein RCF27_09410 [Rhodococcus pyridinivorans]
MALNIVAYRKVSLSGYGEGWDDCYLRVRAANPEQVKSWSEVFESKTLTNEQAEAKFREAANEVVVGGVILNTNEDGSQEKITFDKSQVAEVVAFLDLAALREITFVSSGSDRLKASL